MYQHAPTLKKKEKSRWECTQTGTEHKKTQKESTKIARIVYLHFFNPKFLQKFLFGRGEQRHIINISKWTIPVNELQNPLSSTKRTKKGSVVKNNFE